ncbi:MAG: ABC transporter substrate-binding protein [Streptosporangiaceae bacterium]
MRRLTKVGVVIAAGLLAAACSSTPSGSQGGTQPSGPTGVLQISNESGATWTCGFSPFNPSVSGLSFGPVYEPLIFVNALKSGQTTPWLATSYKWSNGNKTLTFAIRKGVKFSDGSPMSAADVAFTYNMLKQNKALDLNSIWSVLSSVTQQGDNVVMQFKSPAVPYFYYIADQVGIVPMKIWSKLPNPVNFADKDPIGTGAYTVKCSPQLITYTASKHYYQPGEPHIATVLYPSYTSNDPANLDLATGKAQWGGQFIPSIGKFYTSKSPSYHYWFPPVSNVSIFINLKDPVLSDVKVRQAMAYAIDRNKVSTVGEYGYEPASNQTGIVTPTFTSWMDKSASAKYGDYSYNPQKAVSILTADGYKKDSSGLMAKNGKELSFSIVNVGGYSDWVASVQVIQQNLQKVGIKLTPINLAGTDYSNRVQKGQFQLAYDSSGSSGPSPFYELRGLLYGPNTAPIGQLASTNYERYSSAATDALINSYGSTTDPAQQHAIVSKLQQVMLSEVPLIPITESVDWFQYDTSKFSGWVTQQDPYAQPAPYSTPDWGIQLLHLKPAGG